MTVREKILAGIADLRAKMDSAVAAALAVPGDAQAPPEWADLNFREAVEKHRLAEAEKAERAAAREAALAAWRASATLHAARADAERAELRDALEDLMAVLARLHPALLRIEALPARWARLENRDDGDIRLSGAYRLASHVLAVTGARVASAIPRGVPLPSERGRAWPNGAAGFVAQELEYFEGHIVPHPEAPQ